jgi:membrane associated rhomboid family serine protease
MNQNYRPGGFKLLPDVVKNLLIINGLFFVATYVFQNTFSIDLVEKLGLYFPTSNKFRIYQLVTHMFMHGSLMHIFSNMFALWMFGAVLENTWGPKKFLIYYFVTAIGAAGLHLTVQYFEISSLQNSLSSFLSNPTSSEFASFISAQVPDYYQTTFKDVLNAWEANPGAIGYKENALSLGRELYELKLNIPTVGASGAVFGVLLAFGMLFPNTIIYLYFAIPVKAKYFVAFYGLFELWRGIQNSSGDNVAHFAHLGGMLFGFLLIKYWQKRP